MNEKTKKLLEKYHMYEANDIFKESYHFHGGKMILILTDRHPCPDEDIRVVFHDVSDKKASPEKTNEVWGTFSAVDLMNSKLVLRFHENFNVIGLYAMLDGKITRSLTWSELTPEFWEFFQEESDNNPEKLSPTILKEWFLRQNE